MHCNIHAVCEQASVPAEITHLLRENLNPHIFVQPLIRSLMTSSNLTLDPSALAFNYIFFHVYCRITGQGFTVVWS